MFQKVKRKGNPIRQEQGQSLVEMAIMFPFLLIMLIAIIEMAQLFTAYIGVINGARESAIYASLHPDLSDETNLTACTSETQAVCDAYLDRAQGEVDALNLGYGSNLTIYPPTLYSGQKVLNCPITTTLMYTFTTFTSQMSLPLVGRFGLPNYYTLRYSTGMPIRNAATFNPSACP